MRVLSLLLAFVLTEGTAMAQQSQPIRASMEKTAAAAAAAQQPGGRRVELSGDVFNLFDVAAATSFLSADVRSSLYAQPSNYVPARVGQIGIRMTF